MKQSGEEQPTDIRVMTAARLMQELLSEEADAQVEQAQQPRLEKGADG